MQFTLWVPCTSTTSRATAVVTCQQRVDIVLSLLTFVKDSFDDVNLFISPVTLIQQ